VTSNPSGIAAAHSGDASLCCLRLAFAEVSDRWPGADRGRQGKLPFRPSDVDPWRRNRAETLARAVPSL
jgi:hypothetical protein